MAERKNLPDTIKDGLGIAKQGVDVITSILETGDNALSAVDQALTGGRRVLEKVQQMSPAEAQARARAMVEANPGETEALPAPVETASTDQTIAWQRRELAKELYRLQLNLAAGGLIDGKPCDCLSGKHVLGLEALTDETMAMHQDSVYQEILDWTKEVDTKGTPEVIASREYASDYPRMAQEARAFRKRLLGTEDTRAMLTAQEREQILTRAKAKARGKADALVEAEAGL